MKTVFQEYLCMPKDNITGYFLKDDALIKGEGEKPLKTLKRNIIVTRNLSIPNLFDKLIEQREHVFSS